MTADRHAGKDAWTAPQNSRMYGPVQSVGSALERTLGGSRDAFNHTASQPGQERLTADRQSRLPPLQRNSNSLTAGRQTARQGRASNGNSNEASARPLFCLSVSSFVFLSGEAGRPGREVWEETAARQGIGIQKPQVLSPLPLPPTCYVWDSLVIFADLGSTPCMPAYTNASREYGRGSATRLRLSCGTVPGRWEWRRNLLLYLPSPVLCEGSRDHLSESGAGPDQFPRRGREGGVQNGAEGMYVPRY
ncbi:hypothetical protein B0T26DRAFT_30679 [Lasiosphaeria miniovina]|uniref:Uncharacterized protein n=1 Tax=Lasiosphaeria miniovina TaxID=1954250 RepID=A0AA40EDN9_9PEZI|nr:uncharacterized protein B0T26DRAFT_30679 [Lasiosphaeria miniovina]KAK0733641.1 hypothetical protein B0T26DRAFT_30679 [Lasiosphaeria miniovina]